MSALPVPQSPRTYGRLTAPRRHLRAVADRTAHISRLPFLLIIAGLLSVGLLGLVLLNTVLQDQAFEMRALHREQARLANLEAHLASKVDAESSPTALAAKASALGMHPNTHAAFLVVPDGTILGEPTAVEGDEMPSSVVRGELVTTAQQTATDERIGEPVVDEPVAEKPVVEEQAEQPAPTEQEEAPAEPAPAESGTTPAPPADPEPTETPEEAAERRAAEQQARNEAEAERARKAATGGAG